MPFEIYITTAEDIIGSTDAALQQQTGVDEQLVADFLDIPLDNARNAILMAEQLGLVELEQNTGYKAIFPYAEYLVTSIPNHKATILRLVLEHYRPYKIFKFRLGITENVQEAANQVRALFSINAHRNDIASTFVSLGTYTNSLVSEGAGRYQEAGEPQEEYLLIVNDVIQNREIAEAFIRKKIGDEAANWIDLQEVLNPLVTAYQRAALADNDPRAPIVYAGNAIESFLSQIATYHAVNIAGAHGINAKADRLSQANQLSTKHTFMLKYLGHIRNAADHGLDAEIGQSWTIMPKTSIEYVHVAQSVIAAVVASINGNFIV